MWIAYLCTFIVVCAFGIALYFSMREIRELKAERLSLLAELCLVKSTLAMHLNSKLTVVLTLAERRIILNALEAPGFKDRITTPKTRKYIRLLYNALMEKMKKSIEGTDGQV